MHLTSSVVKQVMAISDFVTFTAYKKFKIYFKKAQCVRTGAKISLREKNVLGFGAL